MKVGDKVQHRSDPHAGTGEIVGITINRWTLIVQVRWPSDVVENVTDLELRKVTEGGDAEHENMDGAENA